MRKSQSVPVRIASVVASMALASGCGTKPTHQTLCGDNDGRAVEAEKCHEEVRRSHGGGSGYVPLYHWYYAPFGRTYPPGASLSDATRTMPAGKGVRVAAPARGGFGGTARTSFGS